MRKTTAFILVFAFLASQYARQVSYLQCQLDEYFSIQNVDCDCGKLLLENKETSDPYPINSHHNHLRLDEIGYPCQYVIGYIAFPGALRKCGFLTNSILPAGNTGEIDHPPQAG